MESIPIFLGQESMHNYEVIISLDNLDCTLNLDFY